MLGERVRAARLARGWTQQQLARRAGLSQGGVSQIERGRRPTPHRRTLARLAEALDLDLDLAAYAGASG